MLPEEKARVKIDKQLNNAGWDIVDRKDYLPNYAMAVKEALMQGGKESDYLLFVDNKAIGVVEAKKESDSLGPKVASQAEHYAKTPQNWYGLWFQGLIPLVYLANGNKIYFKNMLTDSDGDYVELGEMHSFLSRLILPCLINSSFSARMRSRRTEAGSSFGSCGTSFPLIARSRILDLTLCMVFAKPL